jgi:Asp-tRNA(Asn)/Glu-tRNA(Gln) amidotransferase A subunit family amidase
VGLTGEGLPIGVQIAGRLHREDQVLGLCRQLEEAMPWRGRVASLAQEP